MSSTLDIAIEGNLSQVARLKGQLERVSAQLDAAHESVKSYEEQIECVLNEIDSYELLIALAGNKSKATTQVEVPGQLTLVDG